MTENGHNSDGLQVALLTVHVKPEMVEQMRSFASNMPWALVHVDYENYFSTAKLPALTQRAIEAQGCIAVVDFDTDPELALETAECLRHSFYHKIAILALSSTTDPDLLLRAMRAGYSEFLSKPFDPTNSRMRWLGRSSLVGHRRPSAEFGQNSVLLWG